MERTCRSITPAPASVDRRIFLRKKNKSRLLRELVRQQDRSLFNEIALTFVISRYRILEINSVIHVALQVWYNTFPWGITTRPRRIKNASYAWRISCLGIPWDIFHACTLIICCASVSRFVSENLRVTVLFSRGRCGGSRGRQMGRKWSRKSLFWGNIGFFFLGEGGEERERERVLRVVLSVYRGERRSLEEDNKGVALTAPKGVRRCSRWDWRWRGSQPIHNLISFLFRYSWQMIGSWDRSLALPVWSPLTPLFFAPMNRPSSSATLRDLFV